MSKVTVELDPEDCVIVGATLRMLGRTTPSPDPTCGDRLTRVGDELIRAAGGPAPRVTKDLVR